MVFLIQKLIKNMLFYLTDSLIVKKSDSIFPTIKRSIRLLAMSTFECMHLLRGDENVLSYYEKEFVGDDVAYPIIHYLVERPTTANVIPSDICNYIEVINGVPRDTVKDGHHIKQVNYDYFTDSSKVQPMRIAVEDLDDCKFYDYVLYWYLKENSLKFSYEYTPVPGGGSNMEDNVKDILQRGFMVTCIADSDKKFKEQADDPESTGYKCSRITCPEGGIYYFLMLNVHELENLIPHNHFNALKWIEQGLKDKNDFFHLCGKAESDQLLPYFDIKEGIKKKHIKALGASYYAYAERCCNLHPTLMGGKSFKDYYDSLASDEDYVYPRLRKRLMNDLADGYKTRSLPYPILMVYQFDEWNRIAKLLLDVACAKNPEAMM